MDRVAWVERFRTNAVLWIFVLLFGGVGVILACWVGLLIVLGLYTLTWPSTTGQVTDSAVTTIVLEDSDNYYPNISILTRLVDYPTEVIDWHSTPWLGPV